MKNRRQKGNCYVTCEALYHLLGGKDGGLTPMVVRHEGATHWFLMLSVHNYNIILDPTVGQFKTDPPYPKARGCGFLTRKPSKRAQQLMHTLVWQNGKDSK